MRCGDLGVDGLVLSAYVGYGDIDSERFSGLHRGKYGMRTVGRLGVGFIKQVSVFNRDQVFWRVHKSFIRLFPLFVAHGVLVTVRGIKYLVGT